MILSRSEDWKHPILRLHFVTRKVWREYFFDANNDYEAMKSRSKYEILDICLANAVFESSRKLHRFQKKHLSDRHRDLTAQPKTPTLDETGTPAMHNVETGLIWGARMESLDVSDSQPGVVTRGLAKRNIYGQGDSKLCRHCK